MEPSSHQITGLLQAWTGGDEHALGELTPVVYRELRAVARRYMAGERPGHTLQATALINEAYIRLIDWKNVRWQNRAHFFAVCAGMMRRILVDSARARGYAKRGGGVRPIPLEDSMVISPERDREILALDDALSRLVAVDERKSKVVELRFFGGLSVDETAEILKVSRRTVINDWNLAKAWLYREMRKG